MLISNITSFTDFFLSAILKDNIVNAHSCFDISFEENIKVYLETFFEQNFWMAYSQVL